MKIHLDFETRSKVDIWEVGAWAYSTHESTEILCLAYQIDGSPIKILTLEDFQMQQHLGIPCEDLLKALSKGLPVCAYNAFFESCVWQNIMVKQYGFPRIPIKQFRCVMAKALARALPRNLLDCGKALNADPLKSEEGKRVMLKLCKPNPKTGEWNEDADDLQRLYDYCADDVAAESAIDQLLPDLIPQEQTIWFLDQLINQRGIHVDLQAIEKAIAYTELFTEDLNQTVLDVSGGDLDSVTRRTAVLDWCRGQGVPVESYTKSEVSRVLEGNLPDNVRTVLEAKLQLGKTSVQKYQAMARSADENGIIRDLLIYHGASTGRWAGKLIQLQNLPKGNVENVDQAIKFLKVEELEDFKCFYPDVMGTLSSCIRGMITSPDGYDLLVADYSAIEARIVLWLADEQYGLRQFQEYDQGKGEEPYVIMSRLIYNDEDISKARRQLGKAAVLGCIGEGSLVYSESGYIPIENISQGQRLWNGEKWVNFQAKVCVGKKNVIAIDAVKLTLDHRILTSQGWQTAAEIAISGDTSHLKLGPSSEDGQLQVRNLKMVQNVMSLSSVNAALGKVAESTYFGPERLHYVANVLTGLTVKEADNPVNILISSLIHVYEENGQPVGGILNSVVKTQITKTSKGMALEVYPSSLDPVKNSWNTLLHWMGMIPGGLPWIELIMPKGTVEEIYASLLKEKTIKTKESLCYDFVNVETEQFQVGSIIAHNCGFGMGPPKFLATCLGWGILVDEALAKRAVETYRSTYPGVPRSWREQENAAITCVSQQQDINCGKITWHMDGDVLLARLPSGRSLAYNNPTLDYTETPWGEKKLALHFMGLAKVQGQTTTKWVKQHTYGGKLVENLTQAVARDILAAAMLRAEMAGYPVAFSVHDEIVSQVPDGFGDITEFESILCRLPMWALDCPIIAKGFRTKRYRKG